MKAIATTVGVALLIQGCSLPQRKTKAIELKRANLVAITYPTELRGAYVAYGGSGPARVCAEPPPDVALDTVQKLSADLSAKHPAGAELDAKASAELSAKVVQLAGRTQMVLLARELLYRACELHLNGTITSQQALAMYGEVVGLMRDLGRADLAQAASEAAKSLAAADAGDVLDRILGSENPN